MTTAMTIEPDELRAGHQAVLFDCRFSLADPEAGRRHYLEGHIPGAHFLDLNRDLSSPVERHGGRHPLPGPQRLAALLAQCGVGLDTEVVAYDDARLAGSSRLWWLMYSLGYRPPRLLNGGYQAWLAAGGAPETAIPVPVPTAAPAVRTTRPVWQMCAHFKSSSREKSGENRNSACDWCIGPTEVVITSLNSVPSSSKRSRISGKSKWMK